MKVRFSRQAIDDLVSIKLFIRQFHPVRAERFISDLSHQCRRIGDFPRAHPLDPREGVRCKMHGRYRILYTIEDNHALILRVLHGARDA